jgi:hypothetical protein
MAEKAKEQDLAKNLRGRAKAALTRIYTFICNENQTFQKHDLLNKLQKIESIYSDFDKADSELPIEMSDMEEFENKYYETKAKLQNALENLSINVHNVINQNEQIPAISSSDIFHNNFKLPRIDIEKYSGNYKDWKSFKDLYISLVHNNESLSNIQKFQYLRGLLIDEPANIIKHIPISDTSYTEAWEKLLSRYDRNKQIITSLVKTFMDQPSIMHANAFNLRNIADTSDEVIRGLKSIDPKANSKDVWLIYILLQKVDAKTREEWAQYSTKNDFPSFEEFIEFINNRCAALELYNNENIRHEKKERQFNVHKSCTNYTVKCILCKMNHFLYKCAKFKELSTKDKRQFVHKHRLCENCFSDKHFKAQCNSTFSCHFCKQRHHSSLHETNFQSYVISANSNETASHESKATSDAILVPDSSASKTESTSLNSAQTTFALLPTANAYVSDSLGQKQLVRVMCDSGSESTFISEACMNFLGIKRKNARFPVKGLANSRIAVTKGCAQFDLFSIHNPDAKLSVKAFVLDKLTAPLPAEKINEEHLSTFKNALLADPHFATPNNIDIILGSDYFFSILLPGQITCSQNTLIAQNSIFGFLVSGKLPEPYTNSNSISNLHIYEVNIDNELKRFWELEEVFNSKDSVFSPEEQFVEQHFQETYSVNSDGRFVVKLPFYKSKSELGNSKSAAISRLFGMEKKFRENSDLDKDYKEFMREYELLGHMELVPQNSLNNSETEQYFLPHHAVIKPSSTTTKLRVVFDASCKTSSGASLNSVLGVGPKLQRDVFEILLSFRYPEIVFTADVEKMYRQILVSEEDQNYQQILWRYNNNEEINTYKLKTVTYGLASASYLATRCIKQIALDYTGNPTVSRILQEDIYMDDLLSGSSTVHNAIEICKEISDILHAHGFHLRKWNSNSTAFLETFQENCSPQKNFEIISNINENSKVLGLIWNSASDTFLFKAQLNLEQPLTKRKILSESARIFDPLGLISPCTIVLKIFYQKLWLTKGDWDSPIPQHLIAEWFKFQESFNEINNFSVPRCVILTTNCAFELHGFSDASTFAYAAAIYCRQIHNGRAKVCLLVSKTKVAPIKQVSIPKLELCGAHLLSKLFHSVMEILKNYNYDIFAWTDSKVVLSWLSAHPCKWKTFVANRTSQIIDVLPTKHWRHVPSKENPADIASRGIDPKFLSKCNIWWTGPSWLQLDPSYWPKTELNHNDLVEEIKAEQKSNPVFSGHSYASNDLFEDFFKIHSSLHKITRILAYCQKFIRNCKSSKQKEKPTTNSSIPLTFTEIKHAEDTIIRWVQGLYFHEELGCIKKQKDVPKKSNLRSLYPFADENGLLRVGGRLQNSKLSFNQKHPIILPSQHKISELLIKERHIAHLHAGPSLLSHIIKQSYWIIGGKRLINKCVNKCLKCHRFKTSVPTSQLMGNLPAHRVTLERPFFSCGIDYAGPISIKFNKGRGAKSTKGYIALFICLATKAVHIEAVSDLTTDAFIAALRRFSARRGAPRHIYSDNATNFVGARRKLDEIQQLLISLPKTEAFSYHLTQTSTEWHFIPPASPHFGGIWEAAIRSAKYHIKRVIGETLLTFEELTTLLAQIEALLNSRPLVHFNESDTDCINVLTPSHFLTGDVILSIPDKPLPSSTSFKTRWLLLQGMKRGFFREWQKSYLSSLQQRNKWDSAAPNLRKGDVVLLRDDDHTPGSWPLGRVLDIHPGKDGLVRVVTVKSKNNILKRPIGKVVLLPLYQS